ncbi:hypothetical protein ACSNO4_11620 [Kocuria flava]
MTEAPTAAAPAAVSALSLDDYARHVEERTRFVDFLLAPVRDERAAAA